MHAVIREVTAQPLDAFQVGGESVLDDQILTEAQHVGRVKQRLFLGGDKELLGGPLQALFNADFVRQVIRVIVLIRQARLRRGLVTEVRVFFPVLLQKRTIVQVFEPTAAIGHGRFQHLMPDGQQHIARRHAAELAVGVEIRCGYRLRMVNGHRTIHTHTAFTQQVGEVVQQLVRTIDGFLRATAPLAAHVAVFRHFRVQRRLFRWDVAIIGTAHDHMAQRVPFVPAFDFSFVRRPGHGCLL